MTSRADIGASSSIASGFVVSDAGAVLLGLLAAAGVITDRPALAALGTVVLVLTLVARIWTRHSLDAVHYRSQWSSSRVVEGDELQLTMEIENRKMIPVPWLSVREQLPRDLELIDGTHEGADTFGSTTLVTSTALGSDRRARISFRVRARRRGHYVLGPTRLASGDPFGFYESHRSVMQQVDGLVVLPRVPAAPDLGLALARPIGEHARRAPLNPDPNLPLTVREYASRDAWRDIDWKVTARRGEPWVRVNQCSTDGAIVLLIECETRLQGVWSDSPPLLEDVVRTAAAAASELIAQGHAVGLIANGVPPGDRAHIAIAPASGPRQLSRVLDALARVQPMVVKPLSELVETHAHRVVPYGATVIAIAAILRPDMAQLLSARRRRGAHTMLVNVGEDRIDLAGVTTVHWRPPQPIRANGAHVA